MEDECSAGLLRRRASRRAMVPKLTIFVMATTCFYSKTPVLDLCWTMCRLRDTTLTYLLHLSRLRPS
jgi:hypothetical protein